MTPRERVIAAYEHRQPDKCPWQIGLTIPARAKLVEHFGGEFPPSESPAGHRRAASGDLSPDLRPAEPLPAELALDERLGNHLANWSHEPASTWEEVKPDFLRDEFGVVWDRTVDKDIGVPVEPLITEPTAKALDACEFPDTGGDTGGSRWDGFAEWVAANPDRFRVCNIGFSLYERAWTLRGMANLMMDMIENPEFVDDLLDRICDWNLEIVDGFLEQDIDCIHFGDDWGQQHGLQMGPAHWRRFIKPRQARMYGKVRDAGIHASQHSCGDVREVFPDLIEIGLECFNPFQPEVMDVREMKRLYGDRLAFYGGISTQRTLPYGTPDDVKAEARMMIDQIGAGGGYILSPAHDTPPDVPLENMLALLEVARGQ